MPLGRQASCRRSAEKTSLCAGTALPTIKLAVIKSVLERLPTRATGGNSLFMIAVSLVVRAFIGMPAPMRAMIRMLEDLVEKNAEAMFLRLIQTVIKGLGRFGDFFQFGAAGRKVFRAEPVAFDQVALLVMLLRFLMPFERADRSIFGDVAKRSFERRPILFLSWRQFQSDLQRGDTCIGKGGFVLRKKLMMVAWLFARRGKDT